MPNLTSQRYNSIGTTTGRQYATGGNVVAFTAAGALLVGDAVYITSAGKVDKSTTAANYQTSAGIVVGGKTTGMLIIGASTDVGTAAASTDEIVLVQTSGLAYGVADGTVAQGAAVGVGAAGATKGRLEDTTVATAGQIVGTAMESGTAGSTMLIFVDHR